MSSRQNLQVTPSNHTSTGSISYKNGNPLIQFIIGEQERMLIGQSVRLVGKFSVFKADDTLSTSAESLRISEQLGLYSIIDSLTIKSQATHQVIEEIRHFPRFMASYLSVTSSKQDNVGHLGTVALTSTNYQNSKHSVVEIPTSLNADNKKSGNSFAINLPCGLFNGQNPVPLMANGAGGVGGILVEIQLSPDSNVLFDSGGNATSDSVKDAFYELSDLSISCEVMSPDPTMKIPPASTFEYNSISSYFTTFNSTNAIVNFNLGLSRVLGVFGNVISADKINNRAQNGLTNNYPVNNDSTAAPIKQLFFTRGGERFPLEYNVNALQRDTLASNAANTVADAQIVQEFLNAITQFSKLQRTSVSSINTKYTNGDPSVVNVKVDGGSVAGIGVAYDVISGQGVDFSSVNWGMNMECDLKTDNPQAFYLFVHSKQTLAFSADGISVVR
tara:strand:- start:60 stop:1394 length:1335 start_codon:yes stop_codon:yes gene_type:complete